MEGYGKLPKLSDEGQMAGCETRRSYIAGGIAALERAGFPAHVFDATIEIGLEKPWPPH